MTEKKIEIEAAAFRKLVNHLQERNDIQNADIMNLAGFCRNCISRWYQESSLELGEEISKDEARELIYGMPYKDWRDKYQK
ncbi:MAG: alkaline phosphatase [Rhodobiaceae bacterium]|nr:alkaline phosphatase [Rhodobiaceae bacterium]|tara:strand:+ start:4054 stop:4296 length:243 start_codon:yes stop_codon:yes gene_type:complete